MQITKKLVAFNFISVAFYILFLIFSRGNISNNTFFDLSYALLSVFIVITVIIFIKDYKNNKNHEDILLAVTCISTYIGEIYIYFFNNEATQKWLNIAYIVYAIVCIAFFIGTMFIFKESKYIRFVINIFTEIIVVFINTSFAIWYIIYSRKVDIYYAYYLYIIFNYVMVSIVYSAFTHYEKEKESGDDSKTEYQVFFSKRIWLTFILSVAAIFIMAFFDYYSYGIIAKNKQLKDIIFIIVILVALRECFSFFGFKNLINELEQKIKFTDMLLQYNVNISKDLKKNIDDKKQEIELAKKIQQALIPNKATIVSDTFTIRSKLISAKDMSGDYYDYFSNSNLVVWVVADVMGKGMKAAMLASNLRICLKLLLDDIEYKEDMDPAELLEQVNTFMYDDLSKIGAYITMVIGVFNIKSNKLKVSSAGHVPPMYISQDGIKKVEIKATAIGLKSSTVYNTMTLDLKSGENIVFYTDGVWDVKDDNKNRLGSKRFNDVLDTVKDENLDIADLVIENLDKYKGKNDFCDDVTVSVLSMV